MMRPLLLLGVAGCAALLGGCVLELRIKAKMQGGELTFYSSQKGPRHWCLDRLTVTDRVSEVVMWQMEPHAAQDHQQFCETDFPLRYGHAPPWLVTTVGPRPLSMNRVYVVEGWSGNHLRGAFSLEGATVKNVR